MSDLMVVPNNVLTLSEHVDRILECRTRVRVAFFDYVDAIRTAFEQLSEDEFQKDLANQLGMTSSTLNRFMSIGNSQLINEVKDQLPNTFSSLYEITLLEKEYVKSYGENDGLKKLKSLVNRNTIRPESETKDIKFLVDKQRRERRDENRKNKETFLLDKEGSVGYETTDSYKTLMDLVEAGVRVRTIVMVPPSDLLTKWSDPGFMTKDLDAEFPISQIRGRSEIEAINILILLPNHRIDVGVKVMKSGGFNYRETFLPPNSTQGFVGGKNSKVLMIGQRGRGSNGNDKSSSSISLEGVFEIAEDLGTGPYLLMFDEVVREGWTCLKTPI